MLGFDQGNMVTTVLYHGTAPVPMTAYFRKVFRVEDPQATPALWLRLLVDDGAVVYLNGAEILRCNMPLGPIGYASPAQRATEATNYLDFVVEPGTLLRETNLLAVEVHQNHERSSDLVLGLELLTGVPKMEELLQQTGTPSPSDYCRAALYLMQELSPKAGPTISALPVPTSYAALARQEASPFNRPLHGLISWNAEWKFLDDGTDQGTAWTKPAFDDRLWKKGAAPLGYPKSRVTTEVSYGTNASQKHVTTYFRREFAADHPDPTQPLLLRLGTGNEGVVVHLNGQEILRNNLPRAETTYLTLATASLDPGQGVYHFVVEPGALLRRTNVLAVELHQSSTGALSVVSFDLELLGGVPSPSELLTRVEVEAARRVLVQEGVPLPEEILAAIPSR